MDHSFRKLADSGPVGTRNAAASITALVAVLALVSLPVLATDFAFVTTTDYETGSSAAIWLDGSHTTDIDVASIHSDAVARWYGGLVYVVNRTPGDNIQVLDPYGGFSTVRQFSTGNGSNPQDIAFRSDTRAYVPLYDSSEILVVDPLTGSHLGSIDLSAFADADGYCEVSRVFIRHDILFATIQRLDRDNYWGPAGGSCVAAIDCATDTLIDADPGTPGIQAIDLVGENPFSELVYDPSTGRLLVSCVGWWGIQDCGIEAIDISTLSSQGYVLTESEAGGDINDFCILDGSTGYAIVTTPSFFTELVPFDPSAGTRGASIYSPGAYVINDIEISPDGELFLADQSAMLPGIRVYDALSGTEITSSPIGTGLPPFDISFSRTGYTGGSIPASAALKACYPNPFNPSTTIEYSLPRPSEVSACIYDARGARIASLEGLPGAAGTHRVVWDGRDAGGRSCASGVYFLRLRAGSNVFERKLVLLR